MKTKVLFLVVLLGLTPALSTATYGQVALIGGLLTKAIEKKSNSTAKTATMPTSKKASNDTKGTDVTLIVTGDGETKDKAINSALRNAIEQAYGTFVSANTTLVNDELTKDEIVTVSNGNIKNYKELSNMVVGNKTIVTLEATVSISNLISYAQAKGASAEFAGATFARSVKMKELYKQNEAKALENLLTQVKLILPSCYDLELTDIGEPKETRQYPNCYALDMYVNFKPNANTKVLCDLFLNTLKSLSMEKSSNGYGSILQILWKGDLNKETRNYVRGHSTPEAELLSKGFNFYDFYLRNSREFRERFWEQLKRITTVFEYSFVITDNLGGKSYLEPTLSENNPFYSLVPHGCIEDRLSSIGLTSTNVNDFVYYYQRDVVNFEKGFRIKIKMVIPKNDIAKYSRFDVSLRK